MGHEIVVEDAAMVIEVPVHVGPATGGENGLDVRRVQRRHPFDTREKCDAPVMPTLPSHQGWLAVQAMGTICIDWVGLP